MTAKSAWSIVIALFLVILALAPIASAADNSPRDNLRRGEILVKFRAGTSDSDVARVHMQKGGRHKGNIAGIGVQVVAVPEGQETAAAQSYAADPAVEFAEPNYTVQAFAVPNDPYISNCYNTSRDGCITQWAWSKIQAYAAWDVVTGTSSVKVAVVDTGIDNSHPDLPSLVAQYDFVNNDTVAEDDNGHGTHVAGTIGAGTNNGVGVAGSHWNVGLMAAKVLDWSGSGTYASVANGIVWAADNGAMVINLSLGGSFNSSTLRSAVDYAWNKGAVLACAAGNSGSSARTYPAAYSNCIAVAATDENDNKASFSNFGAKWVDVAAPGVRILSTLPDTAGFYLNTAYGFYTGYDSMSGTSMATPHVAGLAALVWARGSCPTNSCVRNKIETTADPIPGTGQYWRWGRINAYKAVQ
jgi:thermitase